MSINFVFAGPRTTIQDKGRMGYQNTGFAPSGFMDRTAARRANLVVNNDEREAIIEFCLVGPTMLFTAPANICVSGGDFKIKIGRDEYPADTAVHVEAGQTASIMTGNVGTYGCIAVGGGLAVPEIMGSRSTNLRCSIGGFRGRQIMNGDQLELRNPRYAAQNLSGRRLPERKLPTMDEVLTVRVIPGPQQEAFTEAGLNTFYNSEYKVSNLSDRMGFRLEGDVVETKNGSDIISDGIVLGSVQIAGNGNPIVMMADRQTTGGYAKIATVIHVDIPQFAQLRPSQRVRFQAVTVQEAQKLYREYYEEFARLKRSLIGPLFDNRHPV
ncbi:MAG: biotin-dependent carboxyltransferase family protein [Lachnospiraceae bacterium]|nr:biotin-dependent carboxyltransferase family protein [Lachnospiraceae bacterium]